MASVAIIGAGPAGSSAAITLAGAGLDVTIFEARPFPRVKVCGEFISPSAGSILERFLPPAQLRTLGAQRIDTFDLSCADRQISWELPAPGWALSRAALDSALLELARERGVTILQPSTVRDVAYEESGVEIQLADGTAHRADLVIHADGTGRHDPAGPISHDARFVAAKCHFHASSITPGRVGIRAAPGAYIGTIRVEDGLGTCALVAHRDLVRASKGDFNALLDQAWPAREWTGRPAWAACPLARSAYVRPGDGRSFRIGNAAAAVDPIGGEGISSALWSGSRLGTLLAAAPKLDGTALDGLHRRFAQEYRRRLRTRLPSCRAAAWASMHPALVRLCWPVLGRPAIAIRPWYRLTGKPAASSAVRPPDGFTSAATAPER